MLKSKAKQNPPQTQSHLQTRPVFPQSQSKVWSKSKSTLVLRPAATTPINRKSQHYSWLLKYIQNTLHKKLLNNVFPRQELHLPPKRYVNKRAGGS